MGKQLIMKKLIFTCGLLVSSFSFGADWVLVAQSNNNNLSHFIDKSYYKYDFKTKNAEVWGQTTSYEDDSSEKYISSKSLTKYDCVNKKFKTLASAKFNSSGYAYDVRNIPSQRYDAIFPDTVGEAYWEAACKTKGRGLYLHYIPEFTDLKRLQQSKAP